MGYDEIRQSLIVWLDDNYHFGDAATLVSSDDASFLDNGILDSLGFVALIVLLEDRYRIRIDRKALNRSNFDSMRKIITYVTSHPEFRAA